MNILLATSFFPPTNEAGTEQRTFSYAKNLIERGHKVHVLCVGNFEQGATRYWNGYVDDIYKGIPVRRINLFWQKSPDPNRYLYKNPQTARFIKTCIGEWKPDIVHITSCLTLSASIIEAAKKSKLPVVLTLTDFWFLCHKLNLLKYDSSLCDGVTTSRECIQCIAWGSGIYKKLTKLSSETIAAQIIDGVSKVSFVSRMRVFRGMSPNISERKSYLTAMLNLADLVVAPAKHLYDTMHNGGVTREIRVVQSGHDLSWMHGRPKKTSNLVRFGFIGQFIYAKGVHVLLTAFSKCDWKGKAELHLFGNMDVEPNYWQNIRKMGYQGNGQVIFHGPFPHENLGEVLSGIDVLIVPSVWHENNPRVIQEAFASGTPVIASDVGGIAEYVKHDVNGCLFRRNDSDDLSSKIQQIIENPALIQKFVANIPKVKTIKDEVDEIDALYQKLLFCTK